MQSLLRTRPENLDDLTVQVALVRPGPIQGGAVHPYIERRQKLREDPSLRAAAPTTRCSRSRCARRSASSSSRTRCSRWRWRSPASRSARRRALRRAMSRKRSLEALEAMRARFVEGALANGVDEETANKVYDKLVGFSGFGFPKSHAAAFALLAYQSAWLRHHYPAEFLCALLNAQPMGFYPPASLVRDGAAARGGGAAARRERAALRAAPSRTGAVRIGLGYVRGVGEDEAEGRRRRAAVRRRRRPRPAARPSTGRRSRRSSRRAPATRFGSRRELLWEARRRPAPAERGQRGEAASSRCRSSRPPQVPELPAADRRGSRCSPTTGRRTSRSARTRSSSCARTCPRRRSRAASWREHPARRAGRGRGHGDRAPAAGDRERRRLHAARGRARPGQPDRPAAGLRALPRARPRRAAAPRPRDARARRTQPATSSSHRSRRSARSPARSPGLAEVQAALPRAHHFGHR